MAQHAPQRQCGGRAGRTLSSTTCSCRSSAQPRLRGLDLTRCRWASPVSWHRSAPSSPLRARLALLLSEQWRRLVVATASSHAIVVGDGPVAIQLARNLRRENGRSAEGGGDQLQRRHADPGRRTKLHDVRGDPADLSTLRAAGVSRARELFACTGEGTVNAAIVLRARDEVREAAKQPLAAYALVRDAELGVALRARRIGVTGDRRLRLDFFAVEDIAARRLFDTHPLTLTGGSPVHVVISGFGQLGQAVLREVARRREMVPGSASVKVVIRHATEEEVAKLTDAFPVIVGNCSITIRRGSGASQHRRVHGVRLPRRRRRRAQRGPGHGPLARQSARARRGLHAGVRPVRRRSCRAQRVGRRCHGKAQRVRGHRGGLRASEHQRRLH